MTEDSPATIRVVLEKLKQLKQRLDKAKPSQRPLIAEKVRSLTPGGVGVLESWGYDEG